MSRFALDRSAHFLAGRAEQTPIQKSTTDRLIVLAGQLEATMAFAVEDGVATGSDADLETALTKIEEALAAACAFIVAAAPPAAEETPANV
jgi:hypothetical protein